MARAEAALGAAVKGLFQRFPALLGFAVRAKKGLHLVEVAIHPWYDEGQRANLRAEIVVALLQLMRSEPAVRALVPGRTFARSLH